MFEELAQRLGGSTTRDEVTGTCNGVAVTFRQVDRGDSEGSDYWTEIAAEIPYVPLVLNLRRHEEADATEVATGGMVDVLVGDAAFDTTFLIEGAPAKAIVRLLDRAARELLMKHPYVHVSCNNGHPFRPATTPPDGLLHLTARGRVTGIEHALVLVELLARLAARVPEAIATAEARRAEGAPYRPSPTRSGLVDEVEAVRTIQADRGKRWLRKHMNAGWGITMAFLAGFVVLVLILGFLLR